MRHIAVPNSGTPLDAVLGHGGVTQVLLLYFPSDLDQAAKDAVDQSVGRLLGEHVGGRPTCRGWGVEDDYPVWDGEEGRTGSALAVFIAWESTEEWSRWTETESGEQFAQSIKGLEQSLGCLDTLIACRLFGRRGS